MLYNKNIFILLLPLLIVLGKIIRYTVLYATLVNASSGHAILPYLNGEIVAEIGVSTGASAVRFWRFVNILGLQSYVGFEIFITILWNGLLMPLLINLKQKLTLSEILFLSLQILALNIFSFCLSKEPIQMLFFLVAFLVAEKNKYHSKIIFITLGGIFLVAGITFRSYYVLICIYAVFLGLFFAQAKKQHKIKLHWLLLFLFLFHFCFIQLSSILFPEEYIEIVRVRFRTVDIESPAAEAATVLKPLIASDVGILFSVDYLLMILRILFPLELMVRGVKYLPYLFYQMITSFALLKAIRNHNSNSTMENVIIYFTLAFVFMSAIFEPDLGSWVRHESVIFPLLFIIAYLDKNSSHQHKKELR